MEYFDFFHFNDVYHLSNIETVSKFGSILARHVRRSSAENRGFTIFSGDCFSPSLESLISRGAYMVPVLNSLGVDMACPGNHDFDYGEERLSTLLTATRFPWTLCNYLKPGGSMTYSSIAESAYTLAGMHSYIVRERLGFRFGFFGTGGTDWPSLCQYLPACYVESPVIAARKMARYLRQIEKCDFVIAITHMRLTEDLKVSEATTAHDDCHIDLLLGGHDHEIVCRFAGDTCHDPSTIWQGAPNEDIVKNGRVTASTGRIRVIKSGSDFQSFSEIRIFAERQSNRKARVVRAIIRQVVDIAQTKEYPTLKQHPAIKKLLLNIQKRIGVLIKTPIARMGAPFDGREMLCRTRETNLGNFLCDLLKLYYDVDIAFINSGSIRCDRIIGVNDGLKQSSTDAGVLLPNLLLVRDVLEMLPFQDTFEIKILCGHDITRLLEVSVSEDTPEGKFLQVSGLSFDANKKLPIGSRVSNVNLTPYFNPRTPIKPDSLYTAVVSSFLARGYDGYDDLKGVSTLSSPGQSGQITHAELMMRVFGYSSSGDRPIWEVLSPQTSDSSLIEESGVVSNGEPEGIRFQFANDTEAYPSLPSRDFVWEKRAIDRVRGYVITRICETTGLPIIFPRMDGRINLLESMIDL